MEARGRRRRDWVELAGGLTELDRALVRLLRDDGRRPVEQLASELDVARKTVRRRIGELERRRVVSIVAVPRPEPLGRPLVAVAGVRLDGSQPALEVASRLAAGPRTVHVVLVTGRYHVLAELWCTDTADWLEAADRSVASVPGVAGYELYPRLHLAYQAPAFAAARAAPHDSAAMTPVELDDLDREIAARLRTDGRMSYQDLARDLGASDGLIRGRVLRMLAGGVLAVTSLADPAAVDLPARATIAVGTLPGAMVTEVADRLAELAAVTHVAITAGRFQLLADVACRDPASLADLLETRLRRTAGVGCLEPWLHMSEIPVDIDI
jgi:DNA-binding Lrp family transcriptional regulator